MLEDLGNIKKEILEYMDVRFDLIRLHTAENLSRFISKAVIMLVISCLLCMILLFLSIAAGFLLSSRLHSNELGFLCVAGFYIMLLAVFLLLKKQIVERPVIQSIVKLFFPKFTDDEKK